MAFSATGSGISISDALRAAKAVRGAELGDRAYRILRPRPRGLVRTRAPLFVLLWSAAQEGRLIWQDADGFALLEPPRSERAWRSATGDPRLPLLRFADRYWDLLVLTVPSALALLLALGLWLTLPGLAAALLAALLLALLVLVYVAVLMTAMIVRDAIELVRAIRTRRDEKRKATNSAPFVHWTLPLFHQGVPRRSRALIDQISERLHRLVVVEAEQTARRRGAIIKPLTVAESLVCLLAGATTTPGREALVAATVEPHAIGPDATIAFVATSFDVAPVPEHRRLHAGTVVFLYLAGVVVLVLGIAAGVPDWEREECVARSCAGSPQDYPSALAWSASQLLGWTMWRALGWDLPGPVAHSFRAISLGLFSGLMTLMLPVLVWVAVSQNRRWRSERRGRFKERVTSVTTKTKVLIIVAAGVEHDAVRAAVAEANGTTPRAWHLDHHTVFRLGTVSAAEVLLAQSGQGSLGPGASTLTALSVLEQVRPDYLILTGIGYGLMPDEQRISEIMVSTQIRVLDHKEVADHPEPGGGPIEFPRGPRPDASVTLVNRALAAEKDSWGGPRVHFGPMLTLNTRVSSRALHEYLRAAAPDAIGGDMEGSGIYAAGARGKVDWIVIKGISDWGGHGGADRDVAAAAAARFVVHMIAAGGLNRPPAR
jgi:nucleoside phosphorylase